MGKRATTACREPSRRVAAATLVVVVLLRLLLGWWWPAPDVVDKRYGYSVGRACHAAPAPAPESRPAQCIEELPAMEAKADRSGLLATVILIAHNEAGCAIRRTLIALAERTPRRLLDGVIVSDDSSATPAQTAVADAGGIEGLELQVRWLRSETRLGVARARQRAAIEAPSSVLIFLDAHCEVQRGWLPPILQLLAASPQSVALPAIESIDRLSWAYHAAPLPHHPPRGGFDWNLTFRWHLPTEEERRARGESIAPLPSPAMAGGVLGIRKKLFFELGGYDAGLEVWGTENIEMSLRVWTCGGRLLNLPCSRVGHVFRSVHPFTWPTHHKSITMLRNARRVAAIWLDEYAALVGGAARMTRLGDSLAERHSLRRRLGCQSFRWYLTHVYPDLEIPIGFPEREATAEKGGWVDGE